MTLEQYIELFEKPNFKVEVDTAELLGLFKELRDSRELIKNQAQYIESHIDVGELKNSIGAIKLSNMKEALELIREYKAENIAQKKMIAEYKRLLKLALDDIQTLNDLTVDDENGCLLEDKFESCTECPLYCGSDKYCGWRYQVDALMLIGGEPNE